MKWKEIIWGIILSLSVVTMTYAQNKIAFTASTDAKQVVEGSYFKVTFKLLNADGVSFKAPKFKNFRIVGGPMQGSQITYVNGRMTQSQSYAYELRALKKGKYTIGSASIKANGKQLKSKPIVLEVVKGNKKTQAKGGEEAEPSVYMKIVVNTDKAYVGQQIMADLKLFTTVAVSNYSVNQNPEFKGFFAKELDYFNSDAVREVIEGVQYTTKILKRFVLFPQKEGLLTIAPAQVIVEVGGSSDPFSVLARQGRRNRLETDPVELNIKALPTPPAEFSGAIGQYKVESFINKDALTTDQSITLQIKISGNGDEKRILPPPLNLPTDAFELYEPKTSASTYEEDGQVLCQKLFNYLVVPKKPGQYELAPSFTYFDPDSNKYVVATPNIFNVSIGKGSGKGNSDSNQDFTGTEERDVRFIKSSAALFQNGTSYLSAIWFWGMLIVPLLGLIGVSVYKRIEAKRGNIDLTLLKQQKADKVAQKRLKQANIHLKKDESRAFYDEIAQALWGYVSDKLTIPTSELSKENVKSQLLDLGVSETGIDQFLQLLSTCEISLFAGMDNSAAMDETYKNARTIIGAIESEIDD